MKRLISFVHILFNYICQIRIFASSKVICPSTAVMFGMVIDNNSISIDTGNWHNEHDNLIIREIFPCALT